jgi:hypothetical protein
MELLGRCSVASDMPQIALTKLPPAQEHAELQVLVGKHLLLEEQFGCAQPAMRVGRKTALVALTVVGAEIAADVERVELGEAAPGLWLAAGR